MSVSISGSTAISGLSGMDTNFDDVLEKLYTVEKSQLNQLQAWKSDWQLRYDAFNTVIDQMSAAKQMLATIGSVNHFVSKNAMSTDETVLTALAAGSAADGQHKITVEKLASNAIWCNTSPDAVFQEKSDIINDTGQTVQFSFDYAGRNYTYDIAPNTTLESFVSIINNSSSNPGINISLVNTGRGYVYQIAGRSSGEDNSLTVYSCGLKGMDATGTTSTWSTDTSFTINDPITDPTKYTYTAVLDSGRTVSVSINGDATDDDLITKLTTSVGTGLITATKNGDGSISFAGIRSLTRTASTDTAYTEGGLKLTFANLTSNLTTADPPEDLTVTINLADGNTREFTISSSATRQDFFNQVKQSLASSANPGLNASGAYDLKLGGVTGISVKDSGGADCDVGLTTSSYDATGALTKLTFDATKLSDRIDGLPGGSAESALTYTFVKSDGSTVNVSTKTDSSDLTTGATNQELYDAIKAALGSDVAESVDGSGNKILTFSNVANFSLTSGSVDATGFTTTFKSTPTSLESTNVSLTFDAAKGSDRLDGLDSSATEYTALRYTFVHSDGKASYIDIDTNGQATYINTDGSTSNIGTIQTNDDLKSAIETQFGVTADGDGTVTLNNLKDFYLSSGSASGDGFTKKINQTTKLEASAFYTDGSGNLLLEEPPSLTYTVTLNDGSTETVTLASGSSAKDVRDALQSRFTASGVDAAISFVDADGNTLADDSTTPAYLQITNIQSMTGPKLTGQVVASSNWAITNASNAVYRVDNWPLSMESSSNTISDLLDGVSLTLQGVGESNLTISTDVSSVETSIQNFLDAVNSVLLTIRDLTAVDDDKEVTSNDPNDIGNSNYSKSTLTAEKGGLLTGNYGVQLVKSRFLSTVTGTPPGFQAMASADDLLSGDILSCLANMGIKTDTDATSDTYGLLVIAPSSDFLQQMDEQNYEDMLNKHINELVDFFVSDGKGTSTSADFRYNSHISGITEAGTYDVHYTVDANGEITNVTIGGASCNRDESRGGYYYTCTGGGARGLAISIDDLTVGDHTGQVRIRQGLVQTVQSFLDKELTYNDVNISANASGDVLDAQIALKSQNGAMMTLKSNYATIMSNIDNSISKEQTRLDIWYTRQKNIFSNLETLLAQLSAQQTELESQLSQLGS